MGVIKIGAQLECDKSVFGEFYNNSTALTKEDISAIILQVMEINSLGEVYIGISHHPCGRFTGRYTESLPVPTGIKFFENIDEPEELNERAHKYDYEEMHIICSIHGMEAIRQMEIDVIDQLRKMNPNYVINTKKGGNGNLVEAEIYYLYICFSRLLKS